MRKRTTKNPVDIARAAYEKALQNGIHIDIGSHNSRAKNPVKAKRKVTAKRAPAKTLIVKRAARKANPVNDPAKGALELAIVSAIKAAKTPVKLSDKTENMLTMQARLSFAQGLIQASEIMGVFTRAETKFMLTQLKPDGVIGR